MKISIVSGSHRVNSESERVGRYIEGEIVKKGVTASLLTLSQNPLPLWDEEAPNLTGDWAKSWKPISDSLAAADGYVVITPEWAGMASPGLKNLFLLASRNELAHKPALIVSVSSGVGGAYPIAELRMSSYKNTRIVYLPDHLIVRTAPKMLHGATTTDTHDINLRERINYTLNVLLEYTKALRLVRQSGAISYQAFPFGM